MWVRVRRKLVGGRDQTSRMTLDDSGTSTRVFDLSVHTVAALRAQRGAMDAS